MEIWSIHNNEILEELDLSSSSAPPPKTKFTLLFLLSINVVGECIKLIKTIIEQYELIE